VIENKFPYLSPNPIFYSHTLKILALLFSETSVNSTTTARRNIPDDSAIDVHIYLTSLFYCLCYIAPNVVEK
jgi:hypothetical protein